MLPALPPLDAESPPWLKAPLPDPWRTQSSRVAYENPWLRVREDQVLRPDGQPGIYGVVGFKNHAMAVVPVDAEGFTYLVGQHRYALGLSSWEVPEGGCPLGQDPAEAARRELREETGFEAESLRYLGAYQLSNSVTDEVGAAYLATGLRPGPAQPEGSEELYLQRVPFTQVVAWALQGQITDAVSVIALTRAWAAWQQPEAAFLPFGPFA